MSIPANIVEGREQKTDPEFCRFLRYALGGSTSELEYHMIIARDIKVIKPAQFVEVLTPLKEVRMLLYGLLKCLDPQTAVVDRKEAAVKPQAAESDQQSAGSR